MSLIGDVIDFILADATVAGLIAARIYSDKVPQKPTLPLICYHFISAQRVHSTDGPSGLTIPRIQFDCYGETLSDAYDLSEALRKAIDGKQSLPIQGIFFDGEDNDYQDEIDAYRWRADYMVAYTEATA